MLEYRKLLTMSIKRKNIIYSMSSQYATFEFTDGNEKYIIACAESGIKEVHIEVTYEDFPTTKYPAINGLRYLAESPNDYPNVYMAKYYGVDKIYLDYAP